MPPPPPLPPSRCPRAGLGRAAMPSDFISLLSADLDLESPKSLYSRGESGWGLGRGGGEARPGEPGVGGSPSGAASEPRPGWPVLGAGERPMGSTAAGRGRGGGPAPPPRSRRPHGAQMPSAPGSLRHPGLSAPRRVGPCHTSRAAGPGPPGSGITPDWAPAAIGAPRLLLPGPSSPAKLPPHGRRGLEPVLGAGSPFSSLSRLFVRRRSNPLSLRPSPLPPLVGTAPLDQASFFPRHLIAGKNPNFLFFFFPSLPTFVAFELLTSPSLLEREGCSLWVSFIPLQSQGYRLRLSFENFLFGCLSRARCREGALDRVPHFQTSLAKT